MNINTIPFKISYGPLSLTVLVIGLFAGQNIMAATVYQWTDEEGIVHFSDIAPKDAKPLAVEEIEFVDFAGNDVEPDRYSITSQLEHMSEWRRQATEERLAKKKLALEAKRLAREDNSYQEYEQPDDRVYNPGVYYYPAPAYFNRYGAGYGYGQSFRHHFNYPDKEFGRKSSGRRFTSKIDTQH